MNAASSPHLIQAGGPSWPFVVPASSSGQEPVEDLWLKPWPVRACGLFACHLRIGPSRTRDCSGAGFKDPESSSLRARSQAKHGQLILFKRTHPPNRF